MTTRNTVRSMLLLSLSLGVSACASEKGGPPGAAGSWKFTSPAEIESRRIMTFAEAMAAQGLTLTPTEQSLIDEGYDLVGKVRVDRPILHPHGSIEAPAGMRDQIAAYAARFPEGERSQREFEEMTRLGYYNPLNRGHQTWKFQYLEQAAPEVLLDPEIALQSHAVQNACTPCAATCYLESSPNPNVNDGTGSGTDPHPCCAWEDPNLETPENEACMDHDAISASVNCTGLSLAGVDGKVAKAKHTGCAKSAIGRVVCEFVESSPGACVGFTVLAKGVDTATLSGSGSCDASNSAFFDQDSKSQMSVQLAAELAEWADGSDTYQKSLQAGCGDAYACGDTAAFWVSALHCTAALIAQAWVPAVGACSKAVVELCHETGEDGNLSKSATFALSSQEDEVVVHSPGNGTAVQPVHSFGVSASVEVQATSDDDPFNSGASATATAVARKTMTGASPGTTIAGVPFTVSSTGGQLALACPGDETLSGPENRPPRPAAPSTLGECIQDSDCNDGIACTDDDCDEWGMCGCSNTPDDSKCPGSDQCNIARCSTLSGCVVDAQTGTPCDDGNASTYDDTCLFGSCEGTPMPQDAGTPDAGSPDAGTPEAGPPDAGTPMPDSGPSPICSPGAFGCSANGLNLMQCRADGSGWDNYYYCPNLGYGYTCPVSNAACHAP